MAKPTRNLTTGTGRIARNELPSGSRGGKLPAQKRQNAPTAPAKRGSFKK